MEKSRRENINSRFAIDISCFETPLDIIFAVFGRCGQMLGVLAIMAGTIARLYEPTPESPAAVVPGRKKATAPPVRVACVGNSITYGTGIQDCARDSCPAQLQRMLGPGYVRRGLYINVSRMGNSLVVRFDYADGLSTADGKAPSTFEIAEEEGLYHPATAVIAGCIVVLTSPEVKHPRLVRYGWQPFTRANLVNGPRCLLLLSEARWARTTDGRGKTEISRLCSILFCRYMKKYLRIVVILQRK